MKALKLSENKVLSKSKEVCIGNRNYNPDQKMIELITEAIRCQLPWSKIPNGSMKNCSSESDYDKYLKTVFKHQIDILNNPKKCVFDSWTMSHLEDNSREGNETSIILDLMATEGQVRHYTRVTFR